MNDKKDDGTIDDFLVHHGVKGMKWGVRRSESGRVQLGAAPRRAHANRVAARKRRVEEKVTRAALKEKRIKSLIDDRPRLKQEKLAALKKEYEGASRAERIQKARTLEAFSKSSAPNRTYSQSTLTGVGRREKLADATRAAGLASIGVSLLAKNNPKVRLGAQAASILLSGTAISLYATNERANNKKLLKDWGLD